MNLVKNLNSLRYTLKLANSSRNRIESLYTAKQIKKNDLRQIYMGLYINSVVAFERFLENVFITLLVGGNKSKKIVPKIIFKDYETCFEVLCNGKNKYIDWLPYNKTSDRSLIYFKDGLPFSKISSIEKKNLELLSKIRNFFAHGSATSKNIYIRHLKETMSSIPPSYSDPVVYLRDFYSYPKQTYYEQIFSNVLNTAKNFVSP